MAAAHLLDRTAYGCELSPAYCDVILRRMINLGGETPVLAETGQSFSAVAEARGVPVDVALNRIGFRTRAPSNIMAQTRALAPKGRLRNAGKAPEFLLSSLPPAMRSVVDGHARMAAAQQLGVNEVPALSRNHPDLRTS
jgi:hypothetical protein